MKRKMNLLITGNLGYIGSVMAPYFQERGYEVTGMDSELYDRGCAMFPDLADIPTMRKDIRDAVPGDFSGIDAVIHLAAICNDPLGNLNPDWTYDINHHGTVRLAELAKKAGVKRFILSSSCSMHGKSTEGIVTEDTPVHPITPYGESKIMAEKALSRLAGESFSPVYLRNGTVYGISPRHRLDILLNNLVGWGSTTGNIRILSDGEPWRPVVHILDVCRAFQCVLEAPREAVHDQTIHVGAEHLNYQIKGLAEKAQKTTGCRILYSTGESADQRTYIADFGKIGRVLPDFRPQSDPGDGARELFEAYRRFGLKEADMSGDRFIRLNRIRKLLESGEVDSSLRRI